jgi:hypothetical protein
VYAVAEVLRDILDNLVHSVLVVAILGTTVAEAESQSLVALEVGPERGLELRPLEIALLVDGSPDRRQPIRRVPDLSQDRSPD